MKWYVMLTIIKGIQNDKWDFDRSTSILSARGIHGPWHLESGVRFTTNILSETEAVEKKFINDNGELLFYGYPGDGSIVFNLFAFDSEDDAVNFGAMLEDSFVGII